MSGKLKKLLFGIIGVAVVAVCAFMFLTSDLEHIEDTNGPENFSLTTITDRDIMEREMGSMGLRKSKNNLNGTIRFSSDKFTGVYEVMWTDVLFSSGLTMDFHDFEVNGGNFKMVVVVNGEIVKVVEPDLSVTVDLGTVKGDVSLIIAGESADFSFAMFQSQYDLYGHPA